MSAPVVGGDLFRWELAISDLTLIKQVKQAVMSRKFCSNPGNCGRRRLCLFVFSLQKQEVGRVCGGVGKATGSHYIERLWRCGVHLAGGLDQGLVEGLPRYVFQNVGKGRHCCKQRVRRSKKPEFPMLCVLGDSRFAASSVAAHLCLPGAGRDPYVPWAPAFAGVTGFMMSALIPFTQGGSATDGEELRTTGCLCHQWLSSC